MFARSERKRKGVEIKDKIHKHISFSFSCFFLSFRVAFFCLILIVFILKRVEQKERADKLSDSVAWAHSKSIVNELDNVITNENESFLSAEKETSLSYFLLFWFG